MANTKMGMKSRDTATGMLSRRASLPHPSSRFHRRWGARPMSQEMRMENGSPMRL